MDCVNSDMRAIGTTEHEVNDRTGWRSIASATAEKKAMFFMSARHCISCQASREILPVFPELNIANISSYVKSLCICSSSIGLRFHLFIIIILDGVLT